MVKRTMSSQKQFTQADFEKLISGKDSKLKQYFRSSAILIGNEPLQINFTIAFIGLKLIMEKEKRSWNKINNIDMLIKEVEHITSQNNEDLYNSYAGIFIIYKEEGTNKTNSTEVFNFINILKELKTEALKDEDIKNIYSVDVNEEIIDTISLVMKIHNFFNENIPSQDLQELPFDLFGVIYESLEHQKSKKTLGEFFTGRYIIRPLIRMFFEQKDILDIIEHNNSHDLAILDPFCGSGGFLTETFKYIKEIYRSIHPEISFRQTTSNLKEIAKRTINGFDIRSENIARTKINMTFAGDGFANILRKDSFKDIDEFNNRVKFIITNVPFGKGNKDDAYIHDDLSTSDFLKKNTNKRRELNALIKCVQLLKPTYKALIIVPDGLLEAPSLQAMREWLLCSCKINAIISLPKFSFAPYTKEKTYVLFIQKRINHIESIEELKSEKIYAYIVDNDGHANSDKRYRTSLKNPDGSWKHDELSPWFDEFGNEQLSKIEMAFLNKQEDTKKSYYNEWDEPICGKKYGYLHMDEILQFTRFQIQKIKKNEVNTQLKNSYLQNKLTKSSRKLLEKNIIFQKNGNFSITKNTYIDGDNNLKEDFIPIMDELGIEYDSFEKCFYDIKKTKLIYDLNLIPEKYFRPSEKNILQYDDFIFKSSEIMNKLKNIIGDLK